VSRTWFFSNSYIIIRTHVAFLAYYYYYYYIIPERKTHIQNCHAFKHKRHFYRLIVLRVHSSIKILRGYAISKGLTTKTSTKRDLLYTRDYTLPKTPIRARFNPFADFLSPPAPRELYTTRQTLNGWLVARKGWWKGTRVIFIIHLYTSLASRASPPTLFHVIRSDQAL